MVRSKCSINYLQTPQVPLSALQCLQYLQFLQALQLPEPVQVAQTSSALLKYEYANAEMPQNIITVKSIFANFIIIKVLSNIVNFSK